MIYLHRCFFFHFCTCFDLVCFASIFLLIGSCLFVQMSITPYVGFPDGASRNTKNLSLAAWVIYDPAGELIELQGICLGRTTNNVAKYSTVLELLTEATNLGLREFFVNLDSQLVVLQLNGHYLVRNPYILSLYLRIQGILILSHINIFLDE